MASNAENYLEERNSQRGLNNIDSCCLFIEYTFYRRVSDQGCGWFPGLIFQEKISQVNIRDQ